MQKLVLRCLCSLLVSCGVAEEGPDVQRMDALSEASEFCADWALNACNDSVVMQCGAKDVEACAATQAAFCQSLMPGGNLSDTESDQCLKAVKDAYADGQLDAAERKTVLELGAPCDRLLSKSRGEGEACGKDSDCAEGLRCFDDSDYQGSCQEPDIVEGGYPCGGATEICTDGFYCDGAHCVAQPELGDPCSEIALCQNDQLCVGEADEQVCVSKAKLGTDCNDDADCLSGVCAVANAEGDRICTATLVLSPAEPVCSTLR